MTTKNILKWWGLDVLIFLVCLAIEWLTKDSFPIIATIFGIGGIISAIAFGSVFPFVFLYALFFAKKENSSSDA